MINWGTTIMWGWRVESWMLFDVAITNALIIARANPVLQKQTKSVKSFQTALSHELLIGYCLRKRKKRRPTVTTKKFRNDHYPFLGDGRQHRCEYCSLKGIRKATKCTAETVTPISVAREQTLTAFSFTIWIIVEPPPFSFHSYTDTLTYQLIVFIHTSLQLIYSHGSSHSLPSLGLSHSLPYFSSLSLTWAHLHSPSLELSHSLPHLGSLTLSLTSASLSLTWAHLHCPSLELSHSLPHLSSLSLTFAHLLSPSLESNGYSHTGHYQTLLSHFLSHWLISHWSLSHQYFTHHQ